VRETLATIQREPFIALNQLVALESGDRAREAIAEGKAKDSRDFMLTSAIAQDKALLMAGQPTAIAYVAHDVRVQLPALLQRLVRLAGPDLGSPDQCTAAAGEARSGPETRGGA